MTKITFNNQTFDADTRLSVLDNLLQKNEDIDYSCKSGNCQSCLLKCNKGYVPESAQNGLKSTQKSQGYFLSCQCFPTDDMNISEPNQLQTSLESKIISLTLLSHNVLGIKISCPPNFFAYPGQYIHLITPHKINRCYSIANQPKKDGFIELHVKYIKNGKMSDWLFNTSKEGMSVYISDPIGNCFYCINEPDEKNYSLILAGTTTGLAPLLGIIRESLSQKHQGEIVLFHGGKEERDLYYQAFLHKMASQYKNFTYCPCILEKGSRNIFLTGDMTQHILEKLPKNNQTKLYLCGNPHFVNNLRKKAFLGGIASQNIFCDAFTNKGS